MNHRARGAQRGCGIRTGWYSDATAGLTSGKEAPYVIRLSREPLGHWVILRGSSLLTSPV
jgi:hypothetical protein